MLTNQVLSLLHTIKRQYRKSDGISGQRVRSALHAAAKQDQSGSHSRRWPRNLRDHYRVATQRSQILMSRKDLEVEGRVSISGCVLH